MNNRQEHTRKSTNGSRSGVPARTASAPVARAVPITDTGLAAMTVAQVLSQVALIQQIMGTAMREDEHFGKVPGCGDKPTLLTTGAEKLCLLFRLAPAYDMNENDTERGHREYRVQCTLSSIPTGSFLGQGVSVCTTMEAKYRFRAGAAEPTDKPVPRAYWDMRAEDPAQAQELLGGKGFTTKKVDGKGWMIAKGGEKVETDNPADSYNTVLKMAKKRALVDAVLTATAASDNWLAAAQIKTLYIKPGSPWENGHIKSFHDKLDVASLFRAGQ